MKRKLDGYSLPWAIFILIIVSVLLSSLILMRSISRDISDRTIMRCRLTSDLNFGIEYGLSQTNDIFDSIMLNGPSPIIIKKSKWGYFNILIASGHYNRFSNSIKIVSSPIIHRKKVPTLVVKQARTTVSLTGNTIIKGNIFVPKGFLERAYIEGKSYSRKELCQGTILDSKLFIDHFDKKSFEKRYKAIESSINDTKPILNINAIDSLSNSFDDETIVISSNSFIDLKSIKLTGNIIIRSDSLVRLRESCSISNSIVFAPIVIIEDGFEGQIQIIANDSIHIGEDVHLNFPSSVILTAQKNTTSYIVAENKSMIDGFVYAFSHGRSLISISEKAIVNGHIYSNSFVDCRGTINGSLICNKISTKTKSSFYESILIDANISNQRNSGFMLAGLAFRDIENEQMLIKL